MKRRNIDVPPMAGIAQRVKATREERDMTQRELDRRAEAGRGTTQRIESMHRPEISMPILARIGRALGVRLDWLIWGTEIQHLRHEELAHFGLDITALGFHNQIDRLPGFIEWLETAGARLSLHVVARALKRYREDPPPRDARGIPIGGWSALFGADTPPSATPKAKGAAKKKAPSTRQRAQSA